MAGIKNTLLRPENNCDCKSFIRDYTPELQTTKFIIINILICGGARYIGSHMAKMLGWQAEHTEIETIIATAWKWHQAQKF